MGRRHGTVCTTYRAELRGCARRWFGWRAYPSVDQEIGHTENGELVVAQIPALNAVTIDVDPLTVPIDMTLDKLSQTVVTLPRTGVLIDFAARRDRNAIVRLELPSGRPVPIGAVVEIEGRAERFAVGHDGEAYLTRLSDQQTLIVLFEGKRCRVALPLDPAGPANADVGPLRCSYLANSRLQGEKQ